MIQKRATQILCNNSDWKAFVTTDDRFLNVKDNKRYVQNVL